MNFKQKRDLKNRLSLIYNNIVFQIVLWLGASYLIVLGASYLIVLGADKLGMVF